MAWLGVSALLALLGACSTAKPDLTGTPRTNALDTTERTPRRSMTSPTAAPARLEACKDELSPADNVALSGIAQSIRDDKAHAALAQLDALRLQAPKAQLLRADAFRRVNRPEEARRLYQALLASCLSGQAHHGMGLMLASLHEDGDSLNHLQMARELMPTDAQVRNDLGYALLLRRDFKAARFEFMTAIELAPDLARPRHNLYMLAALQNEDGVKQALARQWGFDASTEARLQDSARQLPLVAPIGPPMIAPPGTPPEAHRRAPLEPAQAGATSP